MNNKSSILAFRQTTLGEIARKDGHGIVDGPFGSNLRASEYVSYGIPVIRGSNLSLGLERFHTKDYVFVSKETANRLNRSLCQPDDIIFTKKGTLGQTGIVPRTEPYKIFLLSSNQMKLSVDIKIANPLFVYYYVSSPASRERIIREAMTTGVPKINLEYLRRFPISLPPLPTQKKIASILSAYDDLIENNTRRIKILEEMAQTLYHEWFVKFRFPGHEQTKMVDSGLGLIPEGWQVKQLGQVTDINASSIKPGNAPNQINYVDISSVTTGKINNIETISFAYSSSRARRIVKHGDIIWSTVRPNRRSYSLILNPIQNLIVSTALAVLTAKEVPYTYLYHALTTDEFVDYLTNNATGSAYPAVNTADFKNAEVLLPSSDVLDKFHRLVVDIFEHRQNLQQKNINLSKTRDLLLPKLISGEIDVEHLDITTEDIAA